MNTQHTQSKQNSVQRRLQQPEQETTVRGVRQDKPHPPHDRIATPQPAPQKNTMRPQQKNARNAPKSKKRKTVSLTLWVRPVVKAELQRIAEQEGLSVSQTGGSFLEEAIRQKLHIQHAVLLQPIIEQAIRKGMRAYSNRLAFLLIRVAYAGEQTRSLVTNILHRHPGITDDMFNRILGGSSKTAKRNITRRTPNLETIITELEALFQDDGEEQRSSG